MSLSLRVEKTLIKTKHLFLVPFGNIGRESGCNSGVVHDVMKRRRFHGLLSQLFRLLLREAPRCELGSGPAQVQAHFPLRIRFLTRLLQWAHVVRIRGPSEQRSPPVGGNGLPVSRVGLGGRTSGGPDHGWSEKRECGCHY